ncbi:MAG: hypothetical protein ACXABY_20195, partial [Candidatus Thorarchaeota archaeon]
SAPLKWHKPVRGFDHYEWYDKEAIKNLPNDYDLLLVDGPPSCHGRSGFIKYWNYFKHDVPILFDDLHRGLDYKVAVKISARLEKPLTVMDVWTGKHWGYIK